MRKIIWMGFLIMLAILATGACSTKTPATTPATTLTTTSTQPATSTTVVRLTQYQLAYRLLSTYPDYFWCDPDFYPVARPGNEQANAIAQFANIQANIAEFEAILEQLDWNPKADYSDAEKLTIYREHKKVTQAISIISAADNYNFTLRVGQNQGKTIQGTISASGQINVFKEETSFNTCPICLAKGTLLETPDGSIAIENIEAGQRVWTQDQEGNRVAAAVLKTSQTAVPPNFQILKVSLGDGRTVYASPGHPSSEMKALSEYHLGDILDGGQITGIEQLTYTGEATFDLLPAGGSGRYWANGILLMSTLFGN